MRQGIRKITSIVAVVCFTLMFPGIEGYAANPQVKIVVNPNKTTIYAGADPIALTSQASGENLTYQWTLNGPGRLDNTGLPAVFYIVPDTIYGKLDHAVVTVRIIDQAGQEVTESITFKILPKQRSEVQSSNSSGMSSTTKVALGLGAAAAVGGVAAIAAGGGSDGGDDDPFTGTFRGTEYSGTTDNGNTYTKSYTFNLQQNGVSITGTIVKTSTLVNCCTVVITAPVSGVTDGDKSANLSWGGAEGSCECSDWTWTSWFNANSGHVTLQSNVLRFDEGAEYYRGNVTPRDGQTDREPYDFIGGDFIRQ